MATDFGTDIDCAPAGLDPLFGLVDGTTALAQAIFRRYETERGTLVDDPDYGLDVQSWIGTRVTTPQIFAWQQALANEARKDERVLRASARIAFDAATKTLRFSVACESAEGPFTLTVAVSDLSVELLSVT